MTPLPTPQQLRYLLALADHQHFGRAADSCAVTQSTLSAGILALERQLDARILDRDGGKRVVFTALGRELVARAREAMVALEAIAEAAAAGRAPMSGPLRLGIIPTIGPFLLPRLMPALRREFPRLRLFLREDTTGRLKASNSAGSISHCSRCPVIAPAPTRSPWYATRSWRRCRPDTRSPAATRCRSVP
jgi:LysR family hydrogen peroxide-inducible transcriptional activator